MESRPAEADAFLVELLKRKRNLNKHLEKIAQAELKFSQGQKLADEQQKKLANKARYTEQLAEVEGWISLYNRTQGVVVTEKPKPVVIVEAPPKESKKPDTRVPDILTLWLTGSYLAEEQVKANYDSLEFSDIVLGEFLAFWRHIQGDELESFDVVATRAQSLLLKYLEGSEELAPQTTRSYAEIKHFVEESAVWLQLVQRPVAEVYQPPQVVDEIVVTTPVFASLVEGKTEAVEWEESQVHEVHVEEVEPEAPQEERQEVKHITWADEDEEEAQAEAQEEAKTQTQGSEEADFTIFTKKKKQPAPAVTRGSRPRGARSNRGGRRPSGRFQAQSGKPGPS